MFEVIIVGHGGIAEGFLSAINMIIGESDGVMSLSLHPDDTLDSYLEKLSQLTAGKEEVLFLADLKGGTPSNSATYLVKKKGYTCISGINLPLILEILMSRQAGLSLDQCVATAKNAAENSIHFITA